ncbi:aspartyl/glutamyl-tRNA(Asn/Gln) amidotransferase subunit C [bacterium BMS3Abin01]|nr:aspartyl/glutamyl-tRNA(Asn/Gln) amidotransferase subunit C [bacterium BMS3Abin01]HDY69766.1 Asp-tRNA(Asn)/Glu-tRNA(Gln) amidotransferase subunit GatC [Actinomycetota bacterium]
MVNHDDVRYVAGLARLKLAGEELDRYAAQLSTILNHVNKIAELELDGVEPTSHVLELTNVFREDEPQPSISQVAALANGPEVEGNAFRVPAIVRK